LYTRIETLVNSSFNVNEMLKDVARCEFNDSFAVFSECDYSNESCPIISSTRTPSGKRRTSSSISILRPACGSYKCLIFNAVGGRFAETRVQPLERCGASEK
jgi:hypothetical protein